MVRRSLVHPNVTRAVGEAYYPQVIDIQRASETQDPNSGQPIQTWVNYIGHLGLKARIGTTNVRQFQASDGTPQLTTQVVSIRGYYPDIDPEVMRVVDDSGETYTIIAVGWDSAHLTTRLEVQKITPESTP